MFYYLFDWLDKMYDIPGTGVFKYISFRSGMAAILSLVISLLIGKYIINLLKRKQISECIREFGPESHHAKKGTPTMGGIIIVLSVIIPTLFFAKLKTVYVVLILIVTLWMGVIGFIDDYIKVFKNDKKGMRATTKLLGQIILGLIIGCTLYFHPDFRDIRTLTTIPFIKNNEFDYAWLSFSNENLAWIIYIPVVIFIITAVSNGVNITDGLDGLASGVSGVIVTALGVLAYLSGNIKYSDYLNIIYLPNSGELAIFCAALVGGCVGFLWYNSYPAQIFMGDTGSLALGGVIGALALMIRKELLVPILCAVFFIESLSVIIQVSYFRYTKKKYGVGKRIFKMSPLHHHYELLGYSEPKIVTRFWIVTGICAVLTIITLKLR